MRTEQNIGEVLQKIKSKKKRKEVQKGAAAEEEEEAVLVEEEDDDYTEDEEGETEKYLFQRRSTGRKRK